MYNPKNEPTQPAKLPLAEPVKKRYEKPEIVYQAPLEATAGLCSTPTGKVTGPPGDLCEVLLS